MNEILTPVQIRVTREMLENTEKNYIPLIDDSEKQKEVYNKYKTFRSCFNSFISNLKEDIYNRKNHNRSLATPKIDPYIAGGAASAIAGTAGGVYAAASTSINNKNISAERSYWKMQTIESKIEVNSSQGKLIKSAEELDNLLNKFPKICQKREEVKENDYQQAIKDYKSLSYKKVSSSEKMFRGLLDYKESINYAIKSSKKRSYLKVLFYEGISFIVAIILPILIGVYDNNPSLGIIISSFVFVVTDLSLRHYFKLY